MNNDSLYKEHDFAVKVASPSCIHIQHGLIATYHDD
jgi:hypothetical protein